MGYFAHSGIRMPPTIAQCGTDITAIVAELWSERYRVERCPGTPTSPEDDRAARWLIWLDGYSNDCAFTVSLLRDGRLEFKVPRSKWDEFWGDQQRLRRRLVQKYNTQPRFTGVEGSV